MWVRVTRLAERHTVAPPELMELVLKSDEDAPRRYRAGLFVVFIRLLRHE
ncbi:MAG: hypothetical protein LV473_03265 [Nitrospira sp.]|nr:hypothetical protein [Nitrospira sp.]